MKCRIRLNDFTHFLSLMCVHGRVDFAKTNLGNYGFSRRIKKNVIYLVLLTSNTEEKYCDDDSIQWLRRRRSRNE